MRKSHRGDVRRQRRRLEEQGDLTLEARDGTHGLEGLLEEGFGVEGSGWMDAEGASIKAHPARRRFYTEVAQWAAERAWLRLAFLRLDERALAFDYCLEFNRTHYLLKTGYDRVYERFSPGKVLRHLERLAVQMTHRASWGHERPLRRPAQEEDSPSPASRDGQERGCSFLRR